MGKVIEGTSGARIYIDDDGVVRKMATKDDVCSRVVAQGHWLVMHRDTLGLPRVINFTPYGYTMQRYDQLQPTADKTDILIRAYQQLSNTLWRRHGMWSPTNYLQFQSYVNDLVNRELPGLGNVLMSFAVSGALLRCTPCDAHGDPTLDNILMDKGNIIIIDPIPSYKGSPMLRSVDIGKIFQSAYGYELIKYQSTAWLVDTNKVLEFVAVNETEADFTAALFFCAVHFLRLIRYQTNEVNRESYRKIAASLCTYF